MIRFLLTVSIFCVAAAAGFGFLNRAKLTRLTQELAEARAESEQARSLSTEVEEKLKQTEDRLATQERLTQQDRDSRNSDINATKAKLNQVTEQLTAKESENRALTATLTE